MYKILINSISSYIDGSNIPKIQANCSAYYCEKIVPDSQNDGEGTFLASLSIAFDAYTIANVVNKNTLEEAKIALNQFVVEEAQKSPLMSIDNLRLIKEEIDAKENARIISQSIIDSIEPLVIWPARIDYENPEIIQPELIIEENPILNNIITQE